MKGSSSVSCPRVLLALALVFVAACDRHAGVKAFKFSGPTMGTQYNVTLVFANGNAVDEASWQQHGKAIEALIQETLDEVNQSMSTYLPASELSRLNEANVGEWISVSEPLAKVLSLSVAMYDYSDGAFDITVGPLVNLWGFGPEESGTSPPSDAEIEVAMQRSGLQHLRVDLANKRVKKHAGIYVDLSAIAKGYGVDEVFEHIDHYATTNGLAGKYEGLSMMVEVGGEVRARGKNAANRVWRLAVETPQVEQTGQYAQVIAIENNAVATSGDYRNFFTHDGKRYSHTIDPKTGKPVKHALASVTVVADTCARADALATAFNVLGYKKSLEIAKRENVPAYFILRADQGYTTQMSPAFKTYMVQ